MKCKRRIATTQGLTMSCQCRCLQNGKQTYVTLTVRRKRREKQQLYLPIYLMRPWRRSSEAEYWCAYGSVSYASKRMSFTVTSRAVLAAMLFTVYSYLSIFALLVSRLHFAYWFLELINYVFRETPPNHKSTDQ